MTKNIIEVHNLVKKFGTFTAVNDITFDVKEGEILGFLGPNGAGKTTTIQMLLGLLTPTSGSILYFGRDLMSYREEIMETINFSSTYTNLPWYLSVKENLTYLSYLYNIKDRKKRISELVEIFKLDPILKKSIGQLSAGQMTRVNIAKAFLNSPKILLLDEPTASLDPDVATYIREFIQSERERFNISILFTSHNMSEVEELCERIIFINNGEIIANDKPENLAKSIEFSHVELLLEKDLKKLEEFCNKQHLTFRIFGKKQIRIDVREKNIAEFLRNLTEQKIIYDEISIDKPSLEDYFLQMSQKKI
ncbi:MAG: ABC transporter ATP-binding protein [Candidatus Levybacteria bacterium]|nr:ABC transporter ATP-binding protein [Candidatus Levybacteria bacterium]